MSCFDKLISPEIADNTFSETLTDLIVKTKPQHVVEVGGSSGLGSTQALIKGALLADADVTIHSLELSRDRYTALYQNTKKFRFVKCYNAAAVPCSEWMRPVDIDRFLKCHAGEDLDCYKVSASTIKSWHIAGIEYLEGNAVPTDGLQLIISNIGGEVPDMVLLDGGPFSGMAELDLVYGANIIALDDVRALKHYDSFQRLRRDDKYYLYRHVPYERSGYAIFIRKSRI